jgi:murein DD-endopeptidase MepM/ murein hydrolase activator NlpD
MKQAKNGGRMQNLNSNPLLKKTSISIGMTVLIILCLSACVSFRGPQWRGEAREARSTETPSDLESTGAPQLTWTGERITKESIESFKFDWPVDEAKMSRGFILGGRKSHWGVDLANRKGTPILASERGTVIYAGRGFHGYGNLIVIEHDQEWATLYAHLDKFLVKEGQQVAQGEQIGRMGRTGHATGVHVHFEIRRHRLPVNPLQYLPAGL